MLALCKVLGKSQRKCIFLQANTPLLVNDNPWSRIKVARSLPGLPAVACSFCSLYMHVQAWRVAHPPTRGNRCMGTQPLVHVGFLKSWLAGNLNEKVTSAVFRAIQQCRKALQPSQKITVFVTGWSAEMCVLQQHLYRDMSTSKS